MHAGIPHPPQADTPPGADTPTPGADTPPSCRHPPGTDSPQSRAPGADTTPEQTPPRADTPPSRHPPSRHPPRADTPPGADNPPGSRLWHTGSERPARILLECILVILKVYIVLLFLNTNLGKGYNGFLTCCSRYPFSDSEPCGPSDRMQDSVHSAWAVHPHPSSDAVFGLGERFW